MHKINVDYIVIGQGLAGTLLAHELIERNKSIIIIDNSELSQASKVAAGIWNPVVFKRLTKSWMVDELLPKMFSRYEQIAINLGTESFLSNKKYYKIISEENEKKFWLKKSKEEMSDFLSQNITTLNSKKKQEVGEVYKAGNLDIRKFLKDSKEYFLKKNILIEETLDYNQIVITSKKAEIHQWSAEKIIFCDGHKITHNPFFNYVSMKPVKGEVITIKSTELISDAIINKGIFILPLKEKNLYKVGATYNWEEVNDIPSKEAVELLVNKLKEVIDSPFEIIKEEAGVRPSVIDRRPVIGPHPKFEKLWVFNGLGTKGVMIGPYFAELVANAICANQTIQDEVNVNRFS